MLRMPDTGSLASAAVTARRSTFENDRGLPRVCTTRVANGIENWLNGAYICGSGSYSRPEFTGFVLFCIVAIGEL